MDKYIPVNTKNNKNIIYNEQLVENKKHIEYTVTDEKNNNQYTQIKINTPYCKNKFKYLDDECAKILLQKNKDKHTSLIIMKHFLKYIPSTNIDINFKCK